MRVSTVLLLISAGIVAAPINSAFRRTADLHDRHQLEPHGTIDHAAGEALLSD